MTAPRALDEIGAAPGRDAFPGPWRITFDTNPDDCNLRCIMCEDHSPYSSTQRDRRAAGLPRRRMDIDLIRRVIAEAAGNGLREIIPSTMGEPLLYRHMDEIIDLCAEYGVKLNLTTNGTFPQRGARAWAERIVPVGSDVEVSWNGATRQTQEQVMLGSNWERVVENVRTFIEVRDENARTGGNRCRATFQLTFMEINHAEIPAVVEPAADRVKGHHLWVHTPKMQGQSLRRSPDAVARWNATVSAAYGAAERCRLPDGGRVLLENIFPLNANDGGDIAPGGECPFLGQEAWVSADGRFNPCCAPDALRKSLGEFGNLEASSLRNIMVNPPTMDRLGSRAVTAPSASSMRRETKSHGSECRRTLGHSGSAVIRQMAVCYWLVNHLPCPARHGVARVAPGGWCLR